MIHPREQNGPLQKSVDAGSENLPANERIENPPGALMQIVLSFDLEEHFRIEAAAGLAIDSGLKVHYAERLELSTRWLLDQLEETHIKATFFVVGQIARHNPALIRLISQSGHEVASHGWDHQRLHNLTPIAFREDVRRSKDALEEITGQPVKGYRAPTFSIVRQTAWALDMLAELDLLYDSSIYPVLHDRYGVPAAPREPFLAKGHCHTVLELPLAILRFLGMRIPIGGGGYFRLLPLAFLECALRQVARACSPPVAVLYFHPWEFDLQQTRLPLRPINRFRTYVGIPSNRRRFRVLLEGHHFTRAVDVAKELDRQRSSLPCFCLSHPLTTRDKGAEPIGRDGQTAPAVLDVGEGYSLRPESSP
jgi:polysaccharide deacetylase family protein (PEP-CTERM system associated)